MKLNVFLLDNLVGYLYTTADRGIVFSYDEKYLSTGKVPLSFLIHYLIKMCIMIEGEED